MTDAFEALRPRIEDYLNERGINLRKRFRCLNPDHPDRNPSMGYDPRRNKVHCFACGADYDLFDLIALDEGCSSPKEALERAKLRYGDGETLFPRPAPVKKTIPPAPPGPPAEGGYFARRGLSAETVRRFGLREENGLAVIPCEGGREVRRSVEGKKYLNEKGRPSPLFQPELLAGDEPAFLAEGAFDALSAEELGFRAAALNGAGNKEKAAALLREREGEAPVMVLTDSDAAGEAWASALCGEFPRLYRCPPVPAGKDLNESLLADREGTKRYLAECLEGWRSKQPPPYASLSAGARMEALERYIEERAARPALETGFPALDRALDGGLHDGLYVLGAVSSLGKTAFCMQIADQLAGQGREVLVFSLEMSAFELMARSVSRETFLAAGKDWKKLGKTVRGVLDGKRYHRYSRRELDHLAKAKRRYAAYASRLWFREGDHETGMEDIRREVRRHVRETGGKPVVLIDYLQIIAPADPRFTDKQNLDRTVCALKKLSREEELTVLAISSFNRENYNAAATMSAFKESGGIDYSADVLLGLQARGAGDRSFNLDEEKRKDPRELELKIIKNRTAGLGQPIPFRYYPAYSCFEEG